MKSNTSEQEILINTTSSFFRRKQYENETLRGCDLLTEEVEGVRWNILLEKWLPEIIRGSSSGHPLHLWQIWPDVSFLHVHLCEYPSCEGDEFSIDSYTFLSLDYRSQ